MPTPDEIIVLQSRLRQAEDAYHNLMLGIQARVIVDGGNGERVEFSPTSTGKLQSYIQLLKQQLGTATTGPMRVFM